MPAEPFTWEVHAQHEVLEDELKQLRDVPYSMWRRVIHAPYTKKTEGRDRKLHKLQIEADWDGPGSVDIRVTAMLKAGGQTLSESFVITPDNRFREDAATET